MNKILLILAFTLSFTTAKAGEGMWLPLLLQQLNEAEMQEMGMKMTAEDIYSVNQGSLKDAIVHFGGFCTGEIISDQGLILTNHHCGYSRIQSHSTLEHNYLEDGFWAGSLAEELANPGLFVTFIVRMEDVTTAALADITDEMSEKERQAAIERNLTSIKANAQKESWQDVMVRPFYHGNQYFMFITETFTDVRLVGTPPSSVGKFGADTDNWVWPRHTGDFSLFRVYAGPDNRPADYSPDNKPYQPKHHLPVSLKGVDEGDFTMVFGFPGRTQQYIPAAAMEMTVDVLNPIKIGIREQALEVINQAMRENPEVRIQYASKQAGIANYWKKWIGERQGILQTGGIDKKQELERTFQQRLNADPQLMEQYGDLLPSFNQLYEALQPYAITRDYVSEIAGGRNSEIFRLVSVVNSLLRVYDNNGVAQLQQLLPRYQSYLEGFFKDYRPEIDQQVFAALMETYFTKVKAAHIAPAAIKEFDIAGKNYEQLASRIFEKTKLTTANQLMALLQADDLAASMETLKSDAAYQFCRAILEHNNEQVMPEVNRLEDELALLQRKYMDALMQVFPEKRFYPDANGTLRVSYGQVQGYEPRDAVRYQPVTYLGGVIEKYQPGDYEFDVPLKLRELYAEQNFGQYADESGDVPVCFIGTNHTSGGNSGSPAVDAEGNLIGLNFDRVWEGTMSDMHYDASICRNIMVDIRYILFFIDKYADAGHLVDEMTLIR